MDKFTLYWCLNFFTFFTMLFCGYMISYRSKTQKDYWTYGILALIVYSLFMGLRWNRLWDYPHYYQDLTGKLYTDYSEVLYVAWIYLFKFTELPFWVGFIFYSAILMYGFLLVLKNYRKAAIWALPLFFTFLPNIDNFVRQYFAMAFLFIGYYFLEKKKYFYMTLFFLCCFLVHFSGLFAISIILLFHFVKIPQLCFKPWLLILFFLILYLIRDTLNFDEFANYLIGFNNLSEGREMIYLENADYWFTQSGDIYDRLGVKATQRSLISTFFYLTTIISVFYYGMETLKNNPKIRIMYWCTIISFIIQVVGGSIEIYSRFYCWLICFYPILIGIIISEASMKRDIKRFLLLIYVAYFFGYNYLIRLTMISPTGYDFIWDR